MSHLAASYGAHQQEVGWEEKHPGLEPDTSVGNMGHPCLMAVPNTCPYLVYIRIASFLSAFRL